jgi:hypothetical protein
MFFEGLLPRSTVSYSYLVAIYHDQSLFQSTVLVTATFTPPVGNGVGSPNGIPLPLKNYRQPDLPRHIFNAQTSYQFNNGLGFTLNALLTSPQNLTFDGSVKIPTQYSLNLAAFYRRKNWEVCLDFYNVTNQKNWEPLADFAGGDSVYAQEPFHLEGTARVYF